MEHEPKTYQVTVWNIATGDIVKKLWEATEEELDEVEEQYRDEPFHEIQIELMR